MIKGKFIYTASLDHYEWDPKSNNIKVSSIIAEKEFPEDKFKNYIKGELICLIILGVVLISLISIPLFLLTPKAGVITLGVLIISLCLISFLYIRNSIKNGLRYDFGPQKDWIEKESIYELFKEEIEREGKIKIKEEARAKRWRKKHPLEEMIRVALETKDSRAIADLIRYCIDVKGELLPSPPEEDKDKIIVKYLNN